VTLTQAAAHHDVTAPVVAGLDLLTARERHADELAFACSTLLTRLGGRDILITTHWAALAEHRHVALVVEVTGLDTSAVTEALTVVAGSASDIQHGDAQRGDIQHGDIQHGDIQHGLLVGNTFDGPPALQPVLEELLDAHRARTSGRVVVFPGSTTLTGTVPVAAVVSSTRIDRIGVLGGADADGGTPLVTRGFVRPRWSGGELVLHTQPAVGGTLVPFETPDPTPCCAAHA